MRNRIIDAKSVVQERRDELQEILNLKRIEMNRIRSQCELEISTCMGNKMQEYRVKDRYEADLMWLERYAKLIEGTLDLNNMILNCLNGKRG